MVPDISTPRPPDQPGAWLTIQPGDFEAVVMKSPRTNGHIWHREAHAQRTRAEQAERERDEAVAAMIGRIEEGTMHHPACNADHRKPLGGAGCCCPNGVTIREIRSRLAEAVAVAEELIDAVDEEFGDRADDDRIVTETILAPFRVKLATLKGESNG